MAAWLSQRSTILSTFSASAINYSTLSGSAITLNSTMISLGASTNSVYTRLSQGNFNSSVSTSSWVSSLTNRVSTTTVAMSANAQYQLALSQSSISTSVMFTSTLGTSWSTLSGASGLPNFSTISYTTGAVSGTGQYGVLGTSAGQLLVTSTFGQTFSGHANITSPTPRIYLPFENSITDSQGNSNVTTLVTPVYVPGIIGNNAINIANTTTGTTAIATQYVRGTWANNLNLTSYTVSFWFNQQTNSGQQYIFSAFNSSLSVQINNNGHLNASIPIAASPFYTSFTIPVFQTIILNTWYNITLIYQSSDICYLYLNNTLYGTIAGAGIYSGGNSGLFSLGSVDNYSGYTFNGYIDDFKIYNSAILPYTNVVSSPTPFIYLPFDGSTADSQGNATITPTGSPNYVSGILGTNAIYLDNIAGSSTVSQYIRGTWVVPSTFTVSLWFNVQQLNGTYQIIFSALSSGIEIFIDPNNKLVGQIPSGTANGQLNVYMPTNVSTNTWYYAVLIYQSNGASSFSVNNTFVGYFPPNTGFGTLGLSNIFGLGTYDNSLNYAFKGYIEDFKIYRSAIPFVNMTSSVAPTIYLPLDTALAGTSTSQGSAPVTITTTGSPPLITSSYVVGSGAVNLNNPTAGGTATKYIRGAWTVPTSFTVNLWFNTQATNQYQMIFSALSSGVVIFISNTNVLAAYIPQGTTGIYSLATADIISTNTWYNTTLIYQANGTSSFYLNNILVGNFTQSTGLAGWAQSTRFSLGTYDHDAANQTYAFVGYIDDFRIYNTALANTLLYPTSISTPLIYLPCDTAPSNGAVTLGVSPISLTVVGTPTQAPSYVMGTGAVRLTNTIGAAPTQYIRGPISLMSNFTVSLWFNVQSLNNTNYQIIFSMFNLDFQIYIDFVTNKLGVEIPNGGSGHYALPQAALSPQAITINTWYSVYVIFQSNGICSFYLNNTLVGTRINSGGTGSTTSVNFSLGTYDTILTSPFNGYIDDVKIYNTAIPFTPMYPPQSFTSTAVSNSGQYMLATMANQGLYMSSNFGGTFSPVTGVLLNALWSNAQISATGQYMLVNAAPVIVQPQLTGLASSGPTALTTSPWQVNGITWIARASSIQVQAGLLLSNLFNNVPTETWASTGTYTSTAGGGGIGDYTGSVSTPIVGTSDYPGEWIQIQSSVPVVMYSYSIAGGASAGWQVPRTYTILGSNDGSIWYQLQTATIASGSPYGSNAHVTTSSIIMNTSGTITVTGSNSATSTYTIGTTAYTTNAYTYFRLCVNKSIRGAFGQLEIGEWYINFQAGGQTYSTNYGATWSNQPALYSQQMLMPGPTVSPQLTGLTGDTTTPIVVQTTWVQNGISWTSNASSTILAAGYQPWVAFNNVGTASTIPYSWASLANYTAGIYNTAGKTPTPISSPGPGDYYGEWLQIQSGVPLIMYSYNFASGGAFTNMAKTYFIVGSTNGSTWVPIQSVTLSSNPFNANSTNASSSAIIVNSSASQTINGGVAVSFTPTVYSTTANAYNYFRIIANTTFGGAFELNEWYVNFLNPNSIAASITYPSTTLALSESGQYALSATVSNPVLLGELNFEGTYADTAPTPTLTYVGNQGGGSNISLSTSQAKVGTSSLYSTNVAGATSSLTYANYTLPAFFTTASAYTISAWIYPTAYPSSSDNPASPFALTNGTTLSSSLLYFYPNGTIGLFYYTTPNSSSALGFISTNSITTNSWSHVAYIFASGMAYLYINGVLSGLNSYTGAICLRTNTNPPTNLSIGCGNSEWGGYRGYVDDLRIYNSALTPQQIQNIYANNVSSPTLTQLTTPSFSVSPQQAGLTTNTWNQGGINWTVSVSSNFDSASKPYALFNNTINFAGNDVWSSVSGGYSGTPGTYNFSTTTSVSGLGAILGEWFQLQSSAPLVMYSYSYTCYNQVGIAKTYYIVGSNDGSTWFPIQLATFPEATNPFTTTGQSQTNFTLVNFNGTQTVTAGTSASLTTTTYSTTTNAYTYFRVIATQIFAGTIAGLFQYSEFAPIFTGPTNTSFYNVISPITNLSTGSSVTAGTIPGVITNSAISNTGQYMALITNNTSGHNVYYSTNYGTTFTGLQLGTSALTSCAMSYDGSYMTIASGATVYTLNNNATGFSVALGNQAGYQNQANNAIAIGNYAGYQNQTANSIILNASGPGALGTGLNAVTQGFYVAPIASYTASSSQVFTLLGYGSDSQITQGIGSISTTLGNVYIGQNAGQRNTTGYLNIFFGENAGQSNTTGNGNVYIGQNVGILNTTGYQNVIIGQTAGGSITTGYNTTLIGNYAGPALTTPYNNTFVGTAAGANTTTGGLNTFLGVLAGAGNITGGNNICIGTAAYCSSSSSVNEIVIGTNITGSGSNTVKIGCGTNVVGTTITFFNNVTYTSMPTYSNVTLQASNATYNMGYISFLKSELGGAYMNIGLANTNNTQQPYLMLLPTNATASHLQPANDNVMTLGSSNQRYVSVFAVNGAIQTSDSNEKNLTILPYGLNELLQMKTIMYKWKSQDSLPDTDPTKHYKYYGLCADQLAAILPELVYDDDPTTPIQMNYSEIIPICVKAIQEQHAEITTLKQQIVDMASQLATLTQRLVNAGIA